MDEIGGGWNLDSISESGWSVTAWGRVIRALTISIIGVLTPLWSVMIVLVSLQLVRTLLELHLNRGLQDPVMLISKAMSRFGVYTMALFGASILEHYVTKDFLPSTGVVSSMIAIDELKKLLIRVDELDTATWAKPILYRLGWKKR